MENRYWPKMRLPKSQRRRAAKRLRRWISAERQATELLVVSHAHCLDGVTSAIVALRSRTGVGVAYAQPSEMAEVLGALATLPGRGRTLLIADLSLQREQLGAIVAACRTLAGSWRVEWLDHHHKQWEGLELGELKAAVALLEVNRDATESGASLVQKHLAPDDAYLRRLAETVRDRDLWQNRIPASEELEFALTALGTRAFVAECLASPGEVLTPALAAAALREREHQRHVLGGILAHARRFGSGDKQVGVVYGWLPKNTGLHELISEGCAVAVNVRPNGKVSLRSRHGADVCHLVGQRFGGGGHPNASGADLGLKGSAYLWYVLRRGRVARVDEMVSVALSALGA
ncbi:MAG: hypothetical protein ACYDBQ_08700 [Thermoplasmatota archaeon]